MNSHSILDNKLNNFNLQTLELITLLNRIYRNKKLHRLILKIKT
jgi:hypothetical protein